MTGINLSKGQKINLSKAAPGLKKVKIGLAWGQNPFDTGPKWDLDVSVFICKNDANGDPKLIDNAHFIFYGKLESPDGRVVHSGDNRTGAAPGDDETITIDLEGLDADELSFVVTIHDETSKLNFGQIKKSTITAYDADTGATILQYQLEDDFSVQTAVQYGSLVKKPAGWVFDPVGQGFNKGLGDFVLFYGGTLA